MFNWMKYFIASVFALSIYNTEALALTHGGGLDAAGCHNDRAAGEYHCHGARRAAVAAPRATKQKRSNRASASRSGRKAKYRPATFYSTTSSSRPRASPSDDFCACSRQRTCTGPRGGVYCINGSGNKSYLPRG